MAISLEAGALHPARARRGCFHWVRKSLCSKNRWGFPEVAFSREILHPFGQGV